MLDGLNEIQSQAAEQIEGPVMVLACAGSGKTRTLTYRIINMIVNHHIDPANILAITFTKKATNVMKERIRSYIDVNVGAITISTFHSLCASILRKDIDKIGYNKYFEIADEEEQVKIITEVLTDLDFNKKRAREFQKIISCNKCFMMKPSKYEEQLVFDKYEEKLREFNMLDFEDLLLKTYELLISSSDVLNKYQEKFKYILVDEFQDTNPIQYEILKLIGFKYKNVFIVGDEDQSIYSFRGTSIENIRKFKEDFEVTNIYDLNPNYRSCKKIIDYANRCIKNNSDRVRKEPMKATSEHLEEHLDDCITYVAKNQMDEASFIVDEIMKLKCSNNSYSDFAILYRNSVLLRNIEMQLIKFKIPYKVFGGISYLKRKEVKDIIAYFKFMMNPNDTLAFKRIINTPTRGIGIATSDKIENIKKTYHIDYLKAIAYSEEVLPKNKFALLNDFKNLINSYKERLDTDNLLDIFDDLTLELRYFDYLKEEFESDEAEERIENLKELKSILYNVETTGLEINKLDRLKLAFDDAILSDSYLPSVKQDKEGVTVSTIHSVKGMEFDTVFIMGMEENIFPSYSRLMDNSDIEEERRIAYVAITRAKNRLYMIYAKDRLVYGQRFENAPSRFLLEALGVKSLDNYMDANVIKSNELIDPRMRDIELKRRNIPEANPEHKKEICNDTSYQVGDTIIHAKYGEGLIIAIENGVGSIFFLNDKVQKKMMLNHPSISKK